MTTISVWDLVKCIAGIMNNFSGLLSIWDPIAAYSWQNISRIVFKNMICFSSYVTSVMAAYVAIERCLCVTIPLEVKWLLTPRVTLIACLLISFVVFGSFSIMFSIYNVSWQWDATLNHTVAIYVKSDFSQVHEGPLFAYYNLAGILWPLASFFIILVATIIIVVRLRQGSKFRFGRGTSSQDRSSAAGKAHEQQQNLLKRDRQVVKMLLVIIIIYICSLAPRIAHYIAKYIIYDFYFFRRHHYLFEFVVYGVMLADSANGAANFFVFYSMSSSFRTTFRGMMCHCGGRSSIYGA